MNQNDLSTSEFVSDNEQKKMQSSIHEEEIQEKRDETDELLHDRDSVIKESPFSSNEIDEQRANDEGKTSVIGAEKRETSSEKKKALPETISTKDKSDQFKTILDIALEYEKIIEDRKKLRSKNKELSESCKKMSDSLLESEKKCEQQAEEIKKLKSEVDHRNEVIDIVKADKSESAQEYKNALAAALKAFYSDFVELKDMEMTTDVGVAMADTLECIFDVLGKNGIEMGAQ